jgi:hypothetical protein
MNDARAIPSLAPHCRERGQRGAEMKPQVLKSDLLKQFIPVAVAASVVAVALVAPAGAAKGGKGPNASLTTTTLALTSERVYWPNTWEPDCMTEDDVVQRNFTGSLSGSYSTSFQLCNLSTDGWTSGGEGLQSKVAVSGSISDLTITAPNGAVTHAVFMGQSRGLSYYEVCVVPPYYASTDTGTAPLAGGTWNITLSGSISSASWTAQVTMTDVNFQQQSCPTSQQNILS